MAEQIRTGFITISEPGNK